MSTKRILLIAIPVIIWVSVSGYLLLGSYGNNQASTATNPPASQVSPQTIPVEPIYSPPTYSPPTSSYSDYSPAWNYSSSDVDVRGYYRKDGTYVKPYSRTKPDGIKSNNYSYPGNYNPNTGKISK